MANFGVVLAKTNGFGSIITGTKNAGLSREAHIYEERTALRSNTLTISSQSKVVLVRFAEPRGNSVRNRMAGIGTGRFFNISMSITTMRLGTSEACCAAPAT
jgi:hypothetical protein